jgi:hypothetical protein
MITHLGFDYETFYATKLGYGIKELGAERYCRDDRFDPYLLSVSDGSNSWAGPPRNFNWDTLDDSKVWGENEPTLVAHNALFDKTVYLEMVRRGWAPLKKVAWHCTANMSSYLCNRRALDDACSFLLNIILDKSTRNEANGKTSDELKADKAGWERMLQYGRGDAFHCWMLWEKYSPQWPEHERELSRITIEQGMRGVQINVELLNEYLRVTETALLVAQFGLPWVASGKSPTSPKAMAEECRRAGIPCPPVKSREGVDAFDSWEAQYIERYPWIKGVSDWRQVNKFLATLKTIKIRLREDGTLPFGLKYFGAHTGRWSGDAGLNFQNFRKVPLYTNDACALIDNKKEAVHTLDVRRLIIPRPEAA